MKNDNLNELAEKGKKNKRKNPLYPDSGIMNGARMLKKLSFLNVLRRYEWGMILMMLSIGSLWMGIINLMPGNKTFNLTVSDRFVYLIFGSFCILLSLFISLYSVVKVSSWKSTLPFKIPADYNHFLNTRFAGIYIRGSGSALSLITIKIRFKNPVDVKLISNAIYGLGRKYIQVEGENSNNSQKIIVTARSFSSGMKFHRFFKRLCENILIPFHQEAELLQIVLNNEEDFEKYL